MSVVRRLCTTQVENGFSRNLIPSEARDCLEKTAESLPPSPGSTQPYLLRVELRHLLQIARPFVMAVGFRPGRDSPVLRDALLQDAAFQLWRTAGSLDACLCRHTLATVDRETTDLQ